MARETGICDSITVATSQSQRDIIINQLGEEIPVVTEPERRDTFPAIALASSYLAYERKCSTDEIVIIIEGQPNAGDKDADGWNLEEKTNPSAMSSIINLKWNDVVLK